MLKKRTINKALTELRNNKAYHIDENTLNLINNLLLALPDDDAWIDPKVTPPEQFVTVEIAMTGFPIAVTGYLKPDGKWAIDNYERKVIEAERIAYWKPLPKVPV